LQADQLWRQLLKLAAPRAWLAVAGASGPAATAVASQLLLPLGQALEPSGGPASCSVTTRPSASSGSR
jgi:hypothetical protein